GEPGTVLRHGLTSKRSASNRTRHYPLGPPAATGPGTTGEAPLRVSSSSGDSNRQAERADRQVRSGGGRRGRPSGGVGTRPRGRPRRRAAGAGEGVHDQHLAGSGPGHLEAEGPPPPCGRDRPEDRKSVV